MMQRLKSLTLPLLLLYLFCVIASQALLVGLLGSGPILPETLAISSREGNISFVILKVVSVTFAVDSLDFNQGYINESCSNCTMDTEGNGHADTECCYSHWASPPADGLLIENRGNTVVSLYLSASENATTWIGGTAPSFQYKMASEATQGHARARGDDLIDSCLSAWNPADWAEATTADTYICGNETRYDFTYAGEGNEGHLLVKAVVPRNASRGNKAVTFQLTATAP